MGRTKQIAKKAQKSAPEDNNENTNNETKSESKKRTFKPSTKALREIRKKQLGTHELINKKPFSDRVRFVTMMLNDHKPLKWTNNAMAHLRRAAENYLHNRFDLSKSVKNLSGRVYLTTGDMQFAAMACNHPSARITIGKNERLTNILKE